MASRIFTTLTLLLASAASLSAHPLSSQRSEPSSEHKEARGLGQKWYHADDHPAVSLFRRQNVQTANGTVAVGSDGEYSARFGRSQLRLNILSPPHCYYRLANWFLPFQL